MVPVFINTITTPDYVHYYYKYHYYIYQHIPLCIGYLFLQVMVPLRAFAAPYFAHIYMAKFK